MKLREGNYSVDQLKARKAERRDNMSYVVYDDLKDTLDPSFFIINE